MKLQAFLMMLAVVFAASCTSASDENVIATAPVEDTTPAIVAKLQALNDSLMATRPAETRGKTTVTQNHDLKGTAMADIRGAYRFGRLGGNIGSLFGPHGRIAGTCIGGLVGGAASSYLKYKENPSPFIAPTRNVVSAYAASEEDSCNFRNYYPISANYTPSDTVSAREKIGPKHNLVLDRLIKNQYTLVPFQDVLDSVEIAVLCSQEFTRQYNNILREIAKTNYEQDFADDDSTEGLIMRQFLNIFTTYPEKAEDVEFIAEKYDEVISKSRELDDIDKQLVFSAFWVAAASYEYWQNNQ